MGSQNPFHPYISLMIALAVGPPSLKQKALDRAPSDRFQQNPAANPRISRHWHANRGWNAAKPVPPP
jgi:hypothetical protein